MKADKGDSGGNSGKKMMIIIVAGVVVAALAGGGAWFLTRSKGGDEHKVEAKMEPPVFLPLDVFTVNLQTETGDQFLQVQFALQVANTAQAELIKANMPKIRSRLLLLLSAKKASELMTVDGKRILSTEIIEAVKRPFTEGGPQQQVSDVLYTSFIIQ